MESKLPLIYHADDDQAFLRLFQHGIQEYGAPFLLQCFPHGESLLYCMENHQRNFILMPQLILLDLDMPRLDGISTLRKLKHKNEFSRIPVIIVSDRENTHVHKDVCKLGAEAFILKPMNLTGILDMVARIDTYLKRGYKPEN